MAKTYNKMQLDVSGGFNDIVTEVQGDQNSRYLDIYLFNNGIPIDLTGHTVRIYMRRPNTNPLEEFFNDGEITEAARGRCQFLLSTQALAKEGELQAQVSIWNGTEEILSTQVFKIMVTTDLRTKGSVESSNEYGALVVLFQNLYEAHDLMVDMISSFGNKGDISIERNINTFWQCVEYLAKYIDTDLCLKIDEALGKIDGYNANEMFIINAMLSDDEYQNEWAFRQNGIGKIINDTFALGNSALANCNTVEEIAASKECILAIFSNRYATIVCKKNKTLSDALIREGMIETEIALASGIGYELYNLEDLIELDFDGAKTKFRVIAKDYFTKGKITLISENILLDSVQWHNSNVNNYETSDVRALVNNEILRKFSSEIQNAIVVSPVPCHNYKTAVTCNDKIWLPSRTELGLGTTDIREGEKFNHFNSDLSRIKYFDGSAMRYWTRSPDSYSVEYVGAITEEGKSYSGSYKPTIYYGLVICFEI